MKLFGISLVMAGSWLLASCTIDRQSTAFECDTQADCQDGRTCISGWCVAQSDAAVGDAPVGVDAPPCNPPCTSCQLDGTCVIACDAANPCDEGVTCPAGVPCLVQCTSSGACTGPIECGNASACHIQCTATGTCSDTITCGSGPCRIDCTNTSSCSGVLDCSASCSCDTDCRANACPIPPMCPDPGIEQCVAADADCDSTLAAECNTCL